MAGPHLTARRQEIAEVFSWALPETFNFGTDIVDAWAKQTDRVALVWCNEAGDERRFTFRDMANRSDRLAGVLQAHGLAKGDRVLVMLPRIPEWQIALVALLKIGAVAIPCISMLREGDVAYRAKNSGACGAITTVANTAKFADLDLPKCRLVVGGEAGGWEDFGKVIRVEHPSYDPVVVAAEDPAVIFYTSGSTGNPKGVTHASRALFAWRVSAEHWLDLHPGDVMFCTADTGWSKAGTSILFGPWSRGATVLFYDGPFEPEKRLELLERHGVTVFCAAATELRHLVPLDLSRFDLSQLRLSVTAGESLNPEVLARWTKATNAPLREAYGLTETLMLVANRPDHQVKAGSMGRPLPGLDLAVIKADGHLAADGEIGQLALRLPSPQLMLGYWEEPGKTAATRCRVNDAEYFLTGDNVLRDGDGYLFYQGRSDDVINSAGYRIGPQEVENALMSHPAVKEVAVVASPDEERGEVVKAFVLLHDGHVPADALIQELQEHVKRMTAPYKYPRRVEFVDALPKSVVGKIQRRTLRDREFASVGART